MKVLKKNSLLELDQNWKCVSNKQPLEEINFNSAKTYSIPFFWHYLGFDSQYGVYCENQFWIQTLEDFYEIGIFTHSIISAHEIYINGNLVGGQGVIVDKKIKEASSKPYVNYFFSYHLKKGENKIVLHAVDFGKAGAIFAVPVLGEKKVLDKHFIFWIMRYGSISLLMLFISVYHFIMYFLNRLENSYLYFSFICLFSSIFNFSFNRFTYWIEPNFLFHFSLFHISFNSLALFVPIFINKLFDLSHTYFSKTLIYSYLFCLLLSIASILNADILIFYRDYVYTFLTPMLNLLVSIFMFYSIYSLKKKTELQVLIMGLGVFVSSIAGLFSILRQFNLGIQNLYTIEGFIFLILCSAVSLSIKMKSIQERLILLEEEFNLKLSEEVLYKTKKINEQKEMLETSNILKDKLFSILAHELRSPMQNLLEVTEIFKEKKMNRSYLDKFMKSVSLDIYNNKYILENLLFWTSSQFKEEKIRIESIHIISLIKELILLFDKNIHKKKLKITLLQKKAIYCQADKSILRLVLSNFFSNSIKYSNFKDEIIFDCQIYQSECRIILKDTGIGIEESKLDLIRKGLPIDSNLGTKNEKGLGIGLHICKHYLNKMNTDFTIESKLGQGTEISFILPLKIYE